MKDELPPPDPDPSQYVRPTQSWICGKAAEGHACRIGPDASGRCRATCECVPILELKEGEKKGRYKCTRPAEYGGPCENGPNPDGTCGRPVTRCQPVRSLRSQRKVVTVFTVSATFAFLLLGLGGGQRWKFISPGPLSSQHSGSGFSQAFLWLHSGARPGDPGCAACHVTAHYGPVGWTMTALAANPGPLRVHTLALTTAADMTGIDQQCERCHLGHNFHEPDVVADHSCSACHLEHQGSGVMKPPTDANCAACHANTEVMRASAEKGRKLPSDAFDFHFHSANGRQIFWAKRPENGYTRVIHSFATDHPEFQVLADKLPDPDTLKFNHQLHLTSPTVTPLNGRQVDCVDCHKLDAAGFYRQKISFDQNCRQCHSLQFDAHNPGLAVPHGNAEFVRAFLRSLPAQYAEYAARKGIAQDDVDKFVQGQMQRIRGQYVNGEELEQRVFFGDSAQGRAEFPACTYCHEVKPAASPDAAPMVTKPVIMDRWLSHGNFNHAKHLTIGCAQCHEVMHSTRTSDVLLPSKNICVECHSPKGGVASNCSTCHSYHAPANSLPVRFAEEARN